ncbi:MULTISPECIES: ABC transporter substrate-binding protein [unclassified Curtobacterium]|uniref:ABC transporter substrate-binding protein n=1 Tax=unclassified Curtobacterium TaxID=257496 RepID=UPI000F476275|nr:MULTISPECIES: ABC transporter substrate-binding protein [unclassified Curtobacterium]ROQ04040.1 peptide/nickel transport system substrate-binding protein [Curtobacterium sp. PhB171]ROQ19305.1 peptide/nickel transport system substrate-binding protein [Curtobacterium sp. PhB170]ROS32793.1 peptide/nickel transport system substrate-binding protein [Curtobacterium sp. PhB131]ROS64356.1 peptide/nickel transport system substrate-binding protein [Curtobacterium sp. PhB141]
MILDSVQKTVAAVASATAVVLVLAGCSGAGTSTTNSKPVTGGTLTYASGDAEPTCLDPHVGGNYPQALLATQYIEELVGLEDGEPTPELATKWTTSDDGKTLTFTLRDDVTFTDGTPFDAAAVVANIEHVQDPATASSTGYLALQSITKATATDDHTVTLTLSRPDSALLESFSQPWVGMESPKALEREQATNCESPVGTGPFEVAGWKHGDRVTLTKNSDYWGKTKPRLSGITWRFLPDSTSRYAALQSGQVDVIDNAQPDQLKAASAKGAIRDLDAPRPGASNRLELNSGHGVFRDEAVRQAFIAGAEIDPGLQSLFLGTAKRSYSVLSSAEPLAYSEKSRFDYSPTKAKQLLDDAGWKVGSDGIRVKDGQQLTVTFPVSTNQSVPAERSLFQQIQASEKAVGFKVVLDELDLSSWYAALAANEYDVVSAPYTKVGPDVLRILYDSASIEPAPSGYFANLAQLDDPALDTLLEQAARTSDADERADLYEQAQKTILASNTVLPLYDQQNHFLVRSAVHGIQTTSVSTPWFGTAWIDR